MIREITLRRFKRFESETFDLNGHVILAGPNNCGKTTVLQAVAAWALALKRWRELHDFQRHGGGYTKAPLARQAFFAVPVRSYDLLWMDRHYGGVVEIEVVLNDGRRITMEFHTNSTEQIYVRPTKTVEPAAIRDLTLDVVHVATVSGLSVEEPVYQPDYIETLLGRQRPGDVIRNLLLQASARSTWGKLTAAIQRMFGTELLVPQTLGGQIVCEYRQRAGAPSFDILSAGSGFQQVVLLMACLFTRQGSVVLVDEPDAHLHVFLQDTIFSELNQAAAETHSQLVIATHSEVIFNSAAPEQICIMLGSPRRLTDGVDVKRLKQAVAVLQQSDLVAALEAPGILYLENYTDLNLLREWANILGHPLSNYFNQRPFWRPMVRQSRDGAAGVKAREHYDAIQLIREHFTGVWLVDGDGRTLVEPSTAPEVGKLNRLRWARYEAESYLVHPVALARFIDRQTGSGGADSVRAELVRAFDENLGSGVGGPVVDAFISDPTHAAPIIEVFLEQAKARTSLLGGILAAGGVHGFEYTRFAEIAAEMRPDEIHPEVKEKLDFIQQAFGL